MTFDTDRVSLTTHTINNYNKVNNKVLRGSELLVKNEFLFF